MPAQRLRGVRARADAAPPAYREEMRACGRTIVCSPGARVTPSARFDTRATGRKFRAARRHCKRATLVEAKSLRVGTLARRAGWAQGDLPGVAGEAPVVAGAGPVHTDGA